MSLAMLEKVVPEPLAGERRPDWPTLEGLRLRPEALASRNDGIGGSDANVILSGNAERVRTLWLEKRGEAEPADLSDNLPAMLGCWTEAFNRMWFEKVTGHAVSRIGEVLQCPRYDWRRCTLDGFIEGEGAVWEAKHSSAFASVDEVIERYMP